ncbi:MAG: diguanylate cyclase, partial [Amphritea sp.]|nr:diguanylate cyclase [Amphritea sp.]
ICGEVLHIGASIGISQYPTDGHTSTELIKNADMAMYTAKRLGKNNIRFFSSDDHDSSPVDS